MSPALEVLARASGLGVMLAAHVTRLRWRCHETPPADLLADLAQHKVSYVELAGTDTPAVIAAKSLLIAGGPHSCPATYLLEEVDVIDPFGLL